MSARSLEIENPFGTDFNDLPTDLIVQDALEVRAQLAYILTALFIQSYLHTHLIIQDALLVR